MRRIRKQSQHGAVIVVAIVAMTVAVGLVSAMLQRTLLTRRALVTQRQIRQIGFLLDAGSERAVAAFRDDASYLGEQWRFAAGELPIDNEAVVTSAVDREDERASIVVIATLTLSPQRSIVRRRTVTVNPQVNESND